MSEYDISISRDMPEDERNALKKILIRLKNEGSFVTVPQNTDMWHVTPSETVNFDRPSFFASSEKWGMLIQVTRNDAFDKLGKILLKKQEECEEMPVESRFQSPSFYYSVHARTNNRRPLLISLTSHNELDVLLEEVEEYHRKFLGFKKNYDITWEEQERQLQNFISKIDGLDGWFRMNDLNVYSKLDYLYTAHEIMFMKPLLFVDIISDRRVLLDEAFKKSIEITELDCDDISFGYENRYVDVTEDFPEIQVDVRIRK